MSKLKQDTEAALQAAADEKKSLLDRLAALEKAAAPTPQSAAVRLSESANTQCTNAIVYAETELPTLRSSPDKEAKRNLVLISTNLVHCRDDTD